MPQSTKPTTNSSIQTPVTKTHHYVRTFFAAIFGFLSLNLIIFSILVVWLSATLTNTDQYVKTVTPIVSDKVVQEYVVGRVTTTILDNKDIPIDGLAENLLPEDQRSGKSNEELRVIIEPMIKESLSQILASPTFNKLWVDTNRSVHASLLSGVNSQSGDVVLNFRPVIVGVIDELGKTKFSFIKDKIDIPSDVGSLKIESTRLDKARHIYNYFKTARIALWACAFLSAVISVLLSVHHLKTLRRIGLFTGIFTGVQAILLSSTSLLKNLKGDATDKAMAIKVINLLVRDLRMSLIVISAVTLILAIGSKLIAIIIAKSRKNSK
jgi:hypothetical protein